MQCKWIKVEGNTTKYYRCNLKDRAIYAEECRHCPMFIQDNKADDVVSRLFGMFGGIR